jgi:ASCH domain
MNEIGLVIKKEPLDDILCGKKTWEIRSSGTKKRRKIALIESGSGEIKGYAELVDDLSLTKDDLLKNISKHQVSKEIIMKGIGYKKPHAWVLQNAKRLSTPKKYKHPQGAVIWVKL